MDTNMYTKRDIKTDIKAAVVGGTKNDTDEGTCNGFGYAEPGDGAEILEIMESDITPGGLKLLYTRRDDPCESFLRESGEARVGVIRAEGRIEATIAAVPRRMYVGGRETRVCYVTNMKRRKDSGAYINWHEMFKEMCDAVDCEYYYCSLLDDNDSVQTMLHKKRRHMPYSIPICGYRTYIISPEAGTRHPDMRKDLECVRGKAEDEEDITAFLTRNGRHRDLFPVIDRLSDAGELKAEDFFLLKRNGKLAAAGALWDRGSIKQYIVKECHGIYALLRFMNPVLPHLGYIRIPGDNEMAPIAYISFLLADDDDEELYRTLLAYICSQARRDYSMLVIGADDMNPKRHMLDRLKSVSFKTQINEVIMTGINGKECTEHGWSNIEVECALL
ncbi:MAG: hypothetical protein IJT37_10710 [Lachnospiraceae bacterium]|nr:hypothetical protein [Lachnospiraceae bacterium]